MNPPSRLRMLGDGARSLGACSFAPGAASSLTGPSRWLLAKSLSLAFPQLAAHLHNKFTHRTPSRPRSPARPRSLTHAPTRDRTQGALSQLQAPRGSGEPQCRHCVSLYYTWNSGPHAFLIDVICTDAMRVSANSVSGAVFVPDLHSHRRRSSEGPRTTNRKPLRKNCRLFLSVFVPFFFTQLWHQRRICRHFVHPHDHPG